MMRKKCLLLLLATTLCLTGCAKAAMNEAEYNAEEESQSEEYEQPAWEVGEVIKDTDIEAKLEEEDDGVSTLSRPYHEKVEIPQNSFEKGISAVKGSTLPKIELKLESTKLSKYEYTDGTVTISNTDYALDTTQVQVRLRGNSTAMEEKMPLKLHFEEKTSLFGGGLEKSWLLLANAFDPTGIHNYLSYNLYHYLQPDHFVPMVEFVDLYVNGKYQGVYTLCDEVETGDKRIDISSSLKDKEPSECDYLIQQDRRCTYEDSGKKEGLDWFWMKEENVAFIVENPETDKKSYTKEHTAYIKSYMDKVYKVILSKDYDVICKYIDVDSFINGFLTEQIVKNQDVDKNSMFYSKVAGGKLKFATIWDCDLAFGSGEIGKADKDDEGVRKNPIFAALWRVPEFKQAYIARFREISEQAEQFVLDLTDEIVATYNREFANDWEQWKGKIKSNYWNQEMNGLSYAEEIDYLKEWIQARFAYLQRDIGR